MIMIAMDQSRVGFVARPGVDSGNAEFIMMIIRDRLF